MALREPAFRRAAIWVKVVLILLGLVVAAAGVVYALGWAATTRWQRYAASLRAKGQPVTFLEIQPLRAVVPEDQNGARVLDRLAVELNDVSKIEASWPNDRPVWLFGRGDDWDPDFFKGLASHRIEPSRQFVRRHVTLLEALKVLGDKSTGQYELAYDPANPIGTLLPALSHARNAGKLEQLAAVLCLIDGDLDAAVDHARIQFRIAATFHDEPILISRLIQMAIEYQAMDATEDLLRVGQPTAKALDILNQEVAERIATDTLKWAFLGERGMFVDTCEAIAGGTMPPSSLMTIGSTGSPMLLSLPRLPAMLLRANQLRGAEMLTWVVEAGDDPQALLKAAQRSDTEAARLPRTQVLTKLLIPSLKRSVQLHLKSGARLLCARAALAAERFRLKMGRLPESLDELVPDYLDAVPTDPFDGQPMRFKTTDDGIVIYSIAENLIDDGGDLVDHPDQTGRNKRPQDVGFRLNRPDRRGLIILDVPPPSDD